MSDTPTFLSVAIPTPLRRTFQYRNLPDTPVSIGSRVQVPFSNRKVVGLVTNLDDEALIDPERLKTVISVYDQDFNLPESVWRLCSWAASYYDHPIGEVFETAVPQLVRTTASPSGGSKELAITIAGRSIPPNEVKRAPAQRALIELLKRKNLPRAALAEHGIKPRTVRTLIGRGWAGWQETAETHHEPFVLGHVYDQGITPGEEQRAAIDSISSHQGHGTFLLQGVTGSGKTEVYLRVIEQKLKAGLQALILVPEIGLTPQAVSRFRSRFDVSIAVLHSGLTHKERADAWISAHTGAAGVILGTRSAVFTPMKNPGVIVVDEEHDSSFKQTDGFRYSARDLAVLRGQYENLPVILGSATPSLESLHNAEQEKYRLLNLKHRPPGASIETYDLIDTTRFPLDEGFSPPLIEEIAERLARDEQVLVFINRRGYAPVLLCTECQAVAGCSRCDAKLTYHLDLDRLVCHHCGSSDREVSRCRSCGGHLVSAIGLGTQRVEQSLRQKFPDTPVIRIDRDSTRKKGAMQDYVDQISKGHAAVLVGTQLLAKGHHFPNVTLVALLDVDSGFYSSDFRALEKLGQLIVQVGGRAGRAEKPGKVLLQTQFAGHPLLLSLIDNGYESFARSLLNERRELDLPPYSFHALIRAESADRHSARSFLENVAAHPSSDPSVDVLGPIPALMEKKAGRYRQLLLLTSKMRRNLHTELEQRVALAENHQLARKVRWAVDVDPIDLF